MTRYGYVVVKPFTITDAGWTTLVAPVPSNGFRIWSVEGAFLIGDQSNVNFQDTILAGEVEDCTVPISNHVAGPTFQANERITDLRAVSGTILVKARFYGPR